MDDDRSNLYIFIVTITIILSLLALLALVFQRSQDGDIENTKRTKAKYELCSTISDPAVRTLCVNSNTSRY